MLLMLDKYLREIATWHEPTFLYMGTYKSTHFISQFI